MGKLDGKIALVTGGARGIGRAIALAFAREGADVAVNDLRADQALEDVVRAIEALGRRSWALPADVADADAVQSMIAQILADAGRVDILVNNAGIANTGPLAEMSVETWDTMIACHLRGTFLCTRFLLPQMLERGSGKVINLGSQIGQIGREGWVHYAAAKGGIISFTRALAREVGPQGVQVNCIAPGPISTGIAPGDPAQEEIYRMTLPLRRFGVVEDVAPTAVFLASADSDYYAGQTLGPNGGDVMQ